MIAAEVGHAARRKNESIPAVRGVDIVVIDPFAFVLRKKRPVGRIAHWWQTDAARVVFAAGQLASDFKSGVPPEARKQEGFPFYGSDIELQTTYILENLKKTFEAAGSSLEHVVKAQVFLTDLDHFHGFDTVWKRYFKVPPPRTTIGCTGLLVADTLVEIDLIGAKN